MTLKKIRLELARDREHPEGSARHGYEFVGPLDEKGHLDPVGLEEAPRALPREAFLAERGRRDWASGQEAGRAMGLPLRRRRRYG